MARDEVDQSIDRRWSHVEGEKRVTNAGAEVAYYWGFFFLVRVG